MMNLEIFRQKSEAFGGDLSRWPEHIRQDAYDFLKANPEDAERVLDEARLIDQVLDAERMDIGTDMLKARIRASIPTPTVQVPEQVQPKRYLGLKAIAAMMTLSFAIGFGSAQFVTPGAEEPVLLSAENELEYLAEDLGMDELYSWVGMDTAP